MARVLVAESRGSGLATARQVAQDGRPVAVARRASLLDWHMHNVDNLGRGATGGAARACSQARCRQAGEHHFGIRPRSLTVIVPPHDPHVCAAPRADRAAVSRLALGWIGRGVCARAPAGLVWAVLAHLSLLTNSSRRKPPIR
jgi:hypothetical protein